MVEGKSPEGKGGRRSIILLREENGLDYKILPSHAGPTFGVKRGDLQLRFFRCRRLMGRAAGAFRQRPTLPRESDVMPGKQSMMWFYHGEKACAGGVSEDKQKAGFRCDTRKLALWPMVVNYGN